MTLENWLQEQKIKFGKITGKDTPLSEGVEQVEKLRNARIEKLSKNADEKKKEDKKDEKQTIFSKLKELIQKIPLPKKSTLKTKLTATEPHVWVSEITLPEGVNVKKIISVTADEQVKFQKTIQEQLTKILQ